MPDPISPATEEPTTILRRRRKSPLTQRLLPKNCTT